MRPELNFKDKKITVMGLGLLGRGLQDTLFFVKKGAVVTVTDLKTEVQLKISLEKLKGLPITYVLGRHRPQDFIDCDFVLRNADVPANSPYLQIAKEHGVPVEMDESFFCKNTTATIIGITGTRGKTTTTLLIFEILKHFGNQKVFLGGNIKNLATLPLLDEVKGNDLVVLELSSWQLQGFSEAKISPQVGVITNIYPDHLNRYPSMQAYINDKKAIFLNQQPNDFLILNEEDAKVKDFSLEAIGQVRFFNKKHKSFLWPTKLLGEHNKENIAAALTAVEVLGLSLEQVRPFVQNFDPIEHRLEFVKKTQDIAFYNDSTSTTPTACVKAIASFSTALLVIIGGADKNLPLQELVSALEQPKVKKIILLAGAGTDRLLPLLQTDLLKSKIVGTYDNLEEAVTVSFKQALPQYTVLFSPAFASFGMFINEYDRGEQFKKIVQSL